jgi:acyl-CoA-binding protein
MSELDLETRFQTAAAASKQLPRRPGNDTLLKMYALYKQATAGDVAGARPGVFDFVSGAKYDAWLALKGVSKEDAMSQYVELIDGLK